MAREEKVWEYAVDAGFTPLEDRCIIVKGAAGDLSEKIVRFFETCDVAVLQMCENELILLPFSPLWATLERDVTLVVPYEDIESVKLVDDLLNVIIDIETRGGAVRLTTQQKELSDIRLSGIYATQYAGGFKNWHAENVNLTLQALSELGHKTSCEQVSLCLGVARYFAGGKTLHVPRRKGLFVPQRWRIYEQTLALGLSVDDPKAFADCIAKALT